MVVILEVDAIEGVAFHYINNFPTLKIVFVSTCDINKRSTVNALTLRPACANPVFVAAALLYIYITIVFKSI